MASYDKQILCIRKDVFFRDGVWGGFRQTNLNDIYERLLIDSEFRLRADLENDPTYLQIIPQVILRHKETFFLHRQVDMNEKRLNSLCPLPLGGHVSEFELDKNSSEDSIQQALTRELGEEVRMGCAVTKRTFLGVVYLDDNDVNRVHIGVVYVFDVDGNDVDVLEDGLEKVGWVTATYLKEHLNELTYWSRVIVDYL